MKIILTSDTHCYHGYLTLPTDADVIVHSGDISLRGQKHEILNFLTWFDSLPYRHKIFIAGNHDFLFEKDPEYIKTIIPESITYLENSGVEIENVKFWGSPITPWFHNWAFNRFRGDEIKKYWDMIPDDVNYLITHGPPYLINDKVNNRYNDNDNVGCRDLKNRLFTLPNLKVLQFGHIHEAQGYTQLNDIHCFNASALNEGYEMHRNPYHYIELDPNDFSVKIL